MIKTPKLQLNQPDATAVHPDRNHLQNNWRSAARRSVGCRIKCEACSAFEVRCLILQIAAQRSEFPETRGAGALAPKAFGVGRRHPTNDFEKFTKIVLTFFRGVATNAMYEDVFPDCACTFV
jgi:hypothetical protein